MGWSLSDDITSRCKGRRNNWPYSVYAMVCVNVSQTCRQTCMRSGCQFSLIDSLLTRTTYLLSIKFPACKILSEPTTVTILFATFCKNCAICNRRKSVLQSARNIKYFGHFPFRKLNRRVERAACFGKRWLQFWWMVATGLTCKYADLYKLS